MIKRGLPVCFALLCLIARLMAQSVLNTDQQVSNAAKLISARSYTEAAAILQKIDSNKLDKKSLTKGLYYQQMARLAYYYKYEDAKAVDYYFKAIRLYELNNSADDIGIGYTNVAGILTDLKDFKRAEWCIQKAMPYVKNDNTRHANALVNHARIKSATGDFAGATALNFTALKLYETTGDKAKIGSGYFQLGINMDQAAQPRKAIDFYGQALRIRKEIADTLGTINVLNNLGIVYKNLNQKEKATESYQAALLLARQARREALQINPLINLGVISKRQGDMPRAIDFNNQALALARAHKRETDIHIIENNLCEIYLKTADYNKALPLARSIAAYGKEKGTLEEKVAFYSNLAEALYGTGNTEEAFKELQSAFYLRDSLHKKEAGTAMAEMAVQFETEKKDSRIRLLAARGMAQRLALSNQQLELDKKELEIGGRDARISLQRTQLEKQQLAGRQQQQHIALLSKEKAIKQLELKQKNIYLLLSFVVILFAVFFAFVYYRRRKLRESMMLQHEKLRISQELHDNIGSQLTFINNFVQSFHAENGQAEKLHEAREITANTIRELRRTVWLINQPEFALDEFIIKLRDYVRPFETGKPLISINTAEGLENCVLKPTTATHLFRIIQEAVNNSIKYADAKCLQITFAKKQNLLSVTIADDGKGFDKGVTGPGYGLKNINSRVGLLKGSHTITTAPGKGTNICVSVPL